MAEFEESRRIEREKLEEDLRILKEKQVNTTRFPPLQVWKGFTYIPPTAFPPTSSPPPETSIIHVSTFLFFIEKDTTSPVERITVQNMKMT